MSFNMKYNNHVSLQSLPSTIPTSETRLYSGNKLNSNPGRQLRLWRPIADIIQCFPPSSTSNNANLLNIKKIKKRGALLHLLCTGSSKWPKSGLFAMPMLLRKIKDLKVAKLHWSECVWLESKTLPGTHVRVTRGHPSKSMPASLIPLKPQQANQQGRTLYITLLPEPPRENKNCCCCKACP